MDDSDAPNFGPPCTTLIRSPIWFDDGSIVLQAENTQFCVHSSYLCQQSVVFRQILDIPKPDDATLCVVKEKETVEVNNGKSVTLVRVSDSAQEMAHLLKALYEPGANFIAGSLNDGNYHMICDVLRLSSKYMIATLRTAMASVICDAYPSTFEDWNALIKITCSEIDEIHRRLEIECEDDWEHEPPQPAIVPRDWILGEDIILRDRDFEVAAVCEEASLLTPLPMVLYYCALRSPLEIFDSALAESTKRRILSGRELLLAGLTRLFSNYGISKACSNSKESVWEDSQCKRSITEHTREWGLHVMLDHEYHPLKRSWQSSNVLVILNSCTDLCESCRSGLQTNWERFRSDNMRYLPVLFDVGKTWVELMNKHM